MLIFVQFFCWFLIKSGPIPANSWFLLADLLKIFSYLGWFWLNFFPIPVCLLTDLYISTVQCTLYSNLCLIKFFVYDFWLISNLIQTNYCLFRADFLIIVELIFGWLELIWWFFGDIWLFHADFWLKPDLIMIDFNQIYRGPRLLT